MMRVPERFAPRRSARLHDRGEEAGALEVGLVQMSPAQHGAVEIGLRQVGAGQHGVGEVGGEEVGAGHFRFDEPRPGEIGALEVDAGKIEPAEVDVGEIGHAVGGLRQPGLEAGEIEPHRGTCRRPTTGGATAAPCPAAGPAAARSATARRPITLLVSPPAGPAPSWRRSAPSRSCRSRRSSPSPCRARTTTACPSRAGRRKRSGRTAPWC